MSALVDNSAVRIAVRERPMYQNINDKINETGVINYRPTANVLIVDQRLFSFDFILNSKVTQQEVFEALIKPMVSKLKSGFNCTALAYGQTGTGKSYTMGLNSSNFEGDDVGLIPRCLREIFLEEFEINNNIMVRPKNREVSVSFIEIYNERAYDLLSENTNEPLMSKGCKYPGGIRKPINNLQEFYRILTQGNRNRHVRPTKLNTHSSRSHAIFTIHLTFNRTHKKRNRNGDFDGMSITSSMHMVDLAGSEGVRRTGHKGMAMCEGVHINQGLLSIGKVLHAMAVGCKVIPYRDSVLCSVLQESLNLNSYLTLLACVSPRREDLSETLSTLRFAQNAKQLKITPQISNILSSIKKSTKRRLTPMKIQNRIVKISSIKRPLVMGVVNGTTKTLVKSNTFCIQKGQCLQPTNKCSKTIMQIEDMKSNTIIDLNSIARDLPHIDCNCNRNFSLEQPMTEHQQSSQLSSNISSCTENDGLIKHENNHSTLSPIVRKCMADLEAGLELRLAKVLHENLQQLLRQNTPDTDDVPSLNAMQCNSISRLTSSIREEVKTMIQEVVAENSETKVIDRATSPTTLIPKDSIKCDLFQSPQSPNQEDIHKKYISRQITKKSKNLPFPVNCQVVCNNVTSNNGNHHIDKLLRRSKRLSQRFVYEHCTMGNDRKSRLSLALEALSETRRPYIEHGLIKEFERHAKHVSHLPKLKQHSLNNTRQIVNLDNNIIVNYLDGNVKTKKIIDRSKHLKEFMDLLNRGSLRELQILPQIGQKTAFQILTYRTLNGKFNNLRQLSELPVWRGNAWKRFAQANMLN